MHTIPLISACRRRHWLFLALATGVLSMFPAVSRADTASVVTAANTLIATSTAAGTSTSVQTSTYTLAIAKQWTNLPGGTRNGPTIGGGPAALSTDLSATVPSGQTISPRAAAIALCQTALSDVGYNTMNEIRNADDVIRSTDNTQSWNYGNYHVAILGTPSTTSPWMLQISGHHLTYNITYNGPFVGATPMFIGTEPPDYYSIGTDLTSTEKAVVVGTINGTTTYLVSSPYNSSSSTTATTTDPGISSGTHRAPLETQRAAVSALANSIQADSSAASSAKLSGTFSDVLLGVTNSGDGNFPFINTTPTYPTGTTGRGVLYSSLSATEQAEVVAMIEAWVNTQASDVSASLLADYLSSAALAQTYVGYQVGAGSADGGTTRCNFDALINQEKTPINSQNSYLRVDGPRVWIEMVVQAAVAYRSDNFVHYHSLWRDKLADYGNEFGGYLDVTNTDTTYSRPTVTAPTSASIALGSTATFTVTATGTGNLSYQWYLDGTAIDGATSSSYVVANATAASAGSYYVVVSNIYGVTASDSATLTVGGSSSSTAPTITTQPAAVSAAIGESASFAVVAAGSGTLAYQWYKDGTAIAGATSSTFSITSVTATDAGSYTVVVTNSAGSVTSSAATLTISATTTVPVVNVTAGGDGEATEGGAKGIFLFTRTGSTTDALTVYYKVKGTAANGTRFTGTGGVALTGTAVIPAGATKLKLKIKAVNDSVEEATEKAKLVLKTPSDGSYTVGTASKAVLLVIDND